jgi:heme A synthase
VTVGRDAVALRSARGAYAAAVLAFFVVILGGFTANIPGAAPACQGFPLCNGRVITEGAAQTIHWVHRLLAFLLTLHVVGLAMAARKHGGEAGAHRAGRRATMVLLGVIILQIVLAAILVSTHLPKVLQSLHQAVGTLVWLSAVVAAGLSAKGAEGAESANSTLPTSAPSAPSALGAP